MLVLVNQNSRNKSKMTIHSILTLSYCYAKEINVLASFALFYNSNFNAFHFFTIKML